MKHTLKPLGKLADIRTGFTFRGAIEEQPGSGVRLLQIADLRDDVLCEDELPEIQWPGGKPPPALNNDDIVMVARGVNNRAAIYKGEHQVVPSNQLFVITITANELLTPDYLCWYLNFEGIQRQLVKARAGNNIPSLKKGELQALEINVPPLSVQKEILAINTLGQRELQTLQQLQQNTETMLSGLFKQLLTGKIIK